MGLVEANKYAEFFAAWISTLSGCPTKSQSLMVPRAFFFVMKFDDHRIIKTVPVLH